VIAHQTKRQKPKLKPLPVTFQPHKVRLSISVVSKDVSALVPTHDNEVQSPRELHPTPPRHLASANARIHA
jgi:hypothetical protein